jgi:hypothetical protein
MGMTWARLGCQVLVMDQLGHGERRQHPFRDAKQYPHAFSPGRQDYYFRYNVGIQLHLIGDSLIGWMVWDLMRGVDLLLSRPGVDKERLILLGAVAGGGDPVAVTAALDNRIKAVVPFNFGGPQPETVFPLPANAEERFNYTGSGSWESTRNLRLSARDGFLPWVIVGAVAPRRLIYGHEFSWDLPRDPVWARLKKIFAFYKVPDHLAATTGRGKLSGRPPESTHCNNIGPFHRKGIYPAFKRWFGMAVPEKEYQQRRPPADLLCLTPEILKKTKARPLHELAEELGRQRVEAVRKRLAALPAKNRRAHLQQEWTRVLGQVKVEGGPKVKLAGEQKAGDVTVARIILTVEGEILVPLVLLLPPRKENEKLPVVVGLAQEGKQRLLRERSELVAGLLGAEIAVCLPDVRGSGETSPGSYRGRRSAATGLSSSELMLGGTLVGSRLRDLSAVLRYLQGRTELNGRRIGLWGDSFAAVNPPGSRVEVPLDAARLPQQSEPLGGLLALLGALFHNDVKAVYAHGGLSGFLSVLQSQFCWLPHDVIVPGSLTAGDLCDVAAALAPRPLRIEGLVNGINRREAAAAVKTRYQPAVAAYQSSKAQRFLSFSEERSKDSTIVKWFTTNLRSV